MKAIVVNSNQVPGAIRMYADQIELSIEEKNNRRALEWVDCLQKLLKELTEKLEEPSA